MIRTLARTIRTAFALFVFSSAALAAGFPNVTQTPGQLLAGPCAPQAGRLTIFFWHNGALLSVARDGRE
jgi:hypothetical protein